MSNHQFEGILGNPEKKQSSMVGKAWNINGSNPKHSERIRALGLDPTHFTTISPSGLIIFKSLCEPFGQFARLVTVNHGFNQVPAYSFCLMALELAIGNNTDGDRPLMVDAGLIAVGGFDGPSLPIRGEGVTHGAIRLFLEGELSLDPVRGAAWVDHYAQGKLPHQLG